MGLKSVSRSEINWWSEPCNDLKTSRETPSLLKVYLKSIYWCCSVSSQPVPLLTLLFSFIHSTVTSFTATCFTGQTPELASLRLSVRLRVRSGALSSMPSSSVWWWVLAGPQASRPVQTYENAVWIWCHLRISWSQLHIFQTFHSALNYISTCLVSIQPTPHINLDGDSIYSRFYCVYFIRYKNVFPLFFLSLKSCRKITKDTHEVDKLISSF